MIKVIPPDAWGHNAFPQPEQVKVASTGLRGHDMTAFLKRASHPLATWVRNNPPKPGEVYLHAVAMGSTEKYGQNRNSDLYGHQMLLRDHPTFEKYARWYLNHRNTDPTKSYGVVKKAWYDPDMGRVETVTALNATKEAAERNGGLVAERTLNKLAADIDVAVSMATRVPGDYCNGCEKFARNRNEYCDESTCKYGGCKRNLGRVYEDGHHLGVDNRNCAFYDLSDVSDTRGADRTAFVTGKVAGHYMPGGAELAELMNLVPPEHLLDSAAVAQLRCLRKLAEAVGHTDASHTVCASWADRVAVRKKLAGGAATEYSRPNSDYGAQTLIADLAADGVLLPPAEWLHLTSGVDRNKCAEVLTRGAQPDHLLTRSDLHDLLGGVYTPRINGKYAWLAKTAKSAGKEAAIAVLQADGPTVKEAAATFENVELAARYTVYQAAVLAAYENSSNFPLLLNEAVRHTRTHSA